MYVYANLASSTRVTVWHTMCDPSLKREGFWPCAYNNLLKETER